MKKIEHLHYFSNERIPSPLACTMQEILMCEAFAQQGTALSFYYPKYRDIPYRTPQEIFDFYNVSTPFEISTFPTFLHLSKPIFDGRQRKAVPFIGGLSVQWAVRRLCARMYAEKKLHAQSVIYARNVHSAFIFSRFAEKYGRPFKTVFEVHALTQHKPERYFHYVLRNVDALICISDSLQKDLIKLGVPKHRILAVPDGVRAEHLEMPITDKSQIKNKYELPTEKPLVVYTGQLFSGKGAELFAQAAALRPDYQFICVGGHGAYLEKFQNTYTSPNLLFTGFVEPARVRDYQLAANVLVLPPTKNHAISPYTSPIKLFEYMAGGIPIVASDLPVLQEIITDRENAVLFKEGDVQDMVAKIDWVLENRYCAEQITARALRDVEQYTWSNRAKRILDFLETL